MARKVYMKALCIKVCDGAIIHEYQHFLELTTCSGLGQPHPNCCQDWLIEVKLCDSKLVLASCLVVDWTPGNTFQWNITVTSQWARWRLKLPASRLLTRRLFRRRSKKASKLRVTGLCEGNSAVTGEFPAHRSSNAEMFPFDDITMIWIKIHCWSRVRNSLFCGRKMEFSLCWYIFTYFVEC